MSHTLRKPRRIFVDASYTISSGKNSGIERVVRKLLSGTQAVARSQGARVPELVICDQGSFFVADQEYINACNALGAKHANILAHQTRTYLRLAGGLCLVLRSQKLRKWLLPQAGHLGIFKLGHCLRQAAARRGLRRRVKPLEAQAGDLFLLPDAYWIQRLREDIWIAAAAARRRGALVSTVLYDLIPLTHPEFVGKKRRDAFLEYITHAATHSDQLLAISQTVRDQVRRFLPTLTSLEGQYCNDIRAFQLGAELDEATPHAAGEAGDLTQVREHVRQVFRGLDTPYLTVATFDPRKNHAYLIDAFEQLWESGQQVSLCLVGRIGARCDEVVQRIQTHAERHQRLFLFEDLSDAELRYCYQRARGVVFPSIVEGFGLPIVEALWFGKKTFASDTPIHREVGGADCSYFDLQDKCSLSNQIIDWEHALAGGSTTDCLPKRQITNWHESSQQVLDAVLRTDSKAAA